MTVPNPTTRITIYYRGTAPSLGQYGTVISTADRCNSDGTGVAILRVADRMLKPTLAALSRHPAVDSYHCR